MEYDPPKLVGRSTKIINEIDLIPVNSAGVAPTATAPENRTGLSTHNVAQGEPEVNTVAEGIRPSKTGRSFNLNTCKKLVKKVKAMKELNKIYLGDCMGTAIRNGYVGENKITEVRINAVDYYRSDAKFYGGLVVGGLLGGPLGALIGSAPGLKAHKVYHAHIKFGDHYEGNAWIDQKLLDYFMK